MPAGLSVLLSLLGQTFGSGDAVMPNDVGGYDDNIIRLGGQNLPIRGTSVAEQVSEFEAGIKIGPATYDNREHAFFVVMDDFSAGLGTRFLNVREELGGFWYSGSEDASYNAADTSRKGYLILPPKQVDTSPTAPAASYGAYYDDFDLNRNWVSRSSEVGFHFFAHGSAVYFSTDGKSMEKLFDSPETWSGMTAFDESFDGLVGASAIIAGSDTNYQFVNFAVGGGGVPEETYGSGAEKTFARIQGLGRDVMWWDNKVLVMNAFGIFFGVWTEDADTGALELTFNTQNPLDGEYIVNYSNARMRFIGTAMAPWGQPSVYFHDRTKMYVLDFFARKYYPVEFGLGRTIRSSVMFNGAILLSDGKNVWEYSPGGSTVRNIGLPQKEGMPPTLRSDSYGGTEWFIRPMRPVDGEVYAVATCRVTADGTPKSVLLKYNGKGWHQIGKRMNYYAAGLAYIVYRNTRVLMVWGQADLSQTSSMAHTYFTLPSSSDTPVPGGTSGSDSADLFGDSGADFITGWMNGGFHDIDGTLLRMKIDAQYLTTSETVKVEFQLNNDEDSDWLQMVDKDNNPEVFDSDHDTLYFSTDPDGDTASYQPRKGITFNSVRFRITLNRGSNEALSPIVKALILMYIKVPDFRLALTFTVDVNRMLEENTDSVYYVDGAEATLRNVHQKLISLWNEHTLHQLIVPNVVTEADNVYVRIVGMPLRFQDFKDSVAGRGTIELSLIEPLERVS